MSKVLVTGASGFIGGHLVATLLEQGHEVVGLVRSLTKTQRLDVERVQLVQGDVTQADSLAAALAGVDTVYHLAGATMALHKADLFRVNEGGTRNLLAACAQRSTPPTVVYLSSMAAAGPTRADLPRVESDPLQPVSNYGRSKLAGEVAAHEYADKLPITVLRPPIVFGEGDPYSISVYRPIVRWGLHFGQGLRKNRFSMIHAQDLCRALILAGETGQRLTPESQNASQGIYFIAADEHPLFGEWGRMISAAAGRKRVLVWSTPGGYWLWAAAAGSEVVGRIRGRPGIFNFDKCREIRGGSWWCSDAALRRDTGFKPAADLLTRIRQTVDWYRSVGWL